MTLTVGIDLASQPKTTAVCVLDWSTRPATVVVLERGELDGRPLDDRSLIVQATRPDVAKVAIDAPFGWPIPFVNAVSGASWPVGLDDRRGRLDLEFRVTDRFVEGWTSLGGRRAKRPLSVSTDKIAMPAMRCAGLLRELGVDDRSGRGLVAEVYPDAALREWGLTVDGDPGYKGAKDPARRRRADVVARLAQLVDLDGHAQRCVDRDDNLDALVCALVARAAMLGLTVPPPPEFAEEACREGWIHLPGRGSLDALR